MTDILCNWLNDDVQLSKKVDKAGFARDFANGYLLGEVFNKYQLQSDFEMFSQSSTSDAAINNFIRVEPVVHLLGISFDYNLVNQVMTEQHEAATGLMYEVFIALNRKQKSNLTGLAMETMRPAAPAKLEAVGSRIYKDQLKRMTPRQTDLNLESVQQPFIQKRLEMEKTAFKERLEEQARQKQLTQQRKEELSQKYKQTVNERSEVLAKIQAATVHIPKPPANKSAKAIQARRDQRRFREADAAEIDIAEFEERLNRTMPPSQPFTDEEARQAIEEVRELPDEAELIKPSSNSEYINKISKRLREDASAAQEREKRRRKVLVDQLKAHTAQEEAHREEMLVNRLMRQSQQERRTAVQLLQARKEKETIKKNRLTREKQYEARRLAEFEEALDREHEMARLAKLDYMEQTKKDRELHEKIMSERSEARYKKHYDMAEDVMLGITDFVTKIGEYRELTNKLLPAKLMREWTALFVAGKPLYEPGEIQPSSSDTSQPTPEQILLEEKLQLLDEGDFHEYREMAGEWAPPENSDIPGPPRNNPIVGHIVQRLIDIVNPPSPPPPPPEFPAFPIKACIVGKVFTGKSSVAKKLAESHRLIRLCVDDLVQDALEAHANQEEMEIPSEVDLLDLSAVNSATNNAEQQPQNPAEGEAQAQGSATAPAPGAPGAEDNKAQEEQAPAAAADPATTGSKSGVPSGTLEKQDMEQPEKGDSEKPVDGGGSGLNTAGGDPAALSSSTVPEITSGGIMLSARARLGAKAAKVLKKGKPLDDPILIDILVEAVKRIPEGTGWIMDGFPSSYNQAKMLEKALSGYDALSKENSKTNLKAKDSDKDKKMRKSVLAPDPKPSPPPTEPGSGINVVVLFDLPNELCLKRSAGRYYTSQGGQDYHQEFHPPPEGAATGVGIQEKVLPVVDSAHDQEQIQTRITAFQDSWPKMEKWFTKFGSLTTVDASQELETVYLETENILEKTLERLQKPPTPPPEPEPEVIPEPPPPEPEPEPEPVVEEEPRSRPTSKKGSRSGSGKRSGSKGSKEKDKKEKGEKEAGKSPSRTNSKEDASGGKKSAKSSRGSSPKSPKRGKSGKKGKKTPEPEPEPEPEVPPGTPPPQPGSDEWVYVDEAIDEELAHILTPYWEAVENTYISNSKAVFRSIRDEREFIVRYFFQIRKDFLEYLRRPDHKQEYVSQFQKEFNEVSDDLRDDEETRQELHQRVDDLRERLWSICDERKEQAENEREGVINDGWLDDHTGILANHYITEMQAEVDRFQDSVRMLKDYYRGMEGKIPDQLPADYARIPLIELPIQAEATEDEAGEAGESAGGGEAPEAAPPTTPGEELRSSKSNTPSGKKKKETSEIDIAADGEGEPKRRIPLIPRRAVSPDANAQGKGKAEKGKGKAAPPPPPVGTAPDDTPQPPEDIDEKLLTDSHSNGYAAIDKIFTYWKKIANEQAAKEAEEAAEREREAAKELEKQKAAQASKGKGKDKGKGKKSRSPSPKKGKSPSPKGKKGKGKDTPTAPTPPPPEEETEEQKQKKLIKERAKAEFFAAIQEEANAAKVRLDLVKVVAVIVLQELRSKADVAYKDMNDWLGARFLKEMESIDTMSEILRDAIERSIKLKEEVILVQEEFLINEDVKTLRTPSPDPRPPAIEIVGTDTFTVEQLRKMHQQFSLTAPTGSLSIRSFQELLFDMSSLSQGMEQVPDFWINLAQDKLELMTTALSCDGEYVDWRSFLLAAAQPWPQPSQTQLLDVLDTFKEMDSKETGYITREQYDSVELWFRALSPVPSPEDLTIPHSFDRLGNIKALFFDIFADLNTDPPQLNYTNMLLYMAVHPDAFEGFMRGLSVASSKHMPRLSKPPPSSKKQSRAASQASLALSVDIEAAAAAATTSASSEKVTIDPTTLLAAEDIPEEAATATVPLDALVTVLAHGQSMKGESHRFSTSTDPDDTYSKFCNCQERERIAGVYQELGATNFEPLQFAILMEHPIIQDIVEHCNAFKATDLKQILSNPPSDPTDAQSLKTE